jgi:hypothetical protein
VIGPTVVGLIIDVVSTTAAFLTAAGFIVVATGAFTVVHTRSTSASKTVPTHGD